MPPEPFLPGTAKLLKVTSQIAFGRERKAGEPGVQVRHMIACQALERAKPSAPCSTPRCQLVWFLQCFSTVYYTSPYLPWVAQAEQDFHQSKRIMARHSVLSQ